MLPDDGRKRFRFLAAFFAAIFSQTAAADAVAPMQGESVVLLHGLARSSDSMTPMAHALEATGYHVCNVSYPSREHSVEKLAADFVAPAVRACLSDEAKEIHFVTHSLGGILVRQLAKSEPDIRIGRVVMLGPPNHGSEVVDRLGGLSLFEWINGPAGLQLGTDAESLPRTLGSLPFETGVISGDHSINPILSLIIPGADDGKVSIESAKLEGMTDFCVVPSSHPFIMKNKQAIQQTLAFLSAGSFLSCAEWRAVTGSGRVAELNP